MRRFGLFVDTRYGIVTRIKWRLEELHGYGRAHRDSREPRLDGASRDNILVSAVALAQDLTWTSSARLRREAPPVAHSSRLRRRIEPPCATSACLPTIGASEVWAQLESCPHMHSTHIPAIF